MLLEATSLFEKASIDFSVLQFVKGSLDEVVVPAKGTKICICNWLVDIGHLNRLYILLRGYLSREIALRR